MAEHFHTYNNAPLWLTPTMDERGDLRVSEAMWRGLLLRAEVRRG
jgi:hypothetical protein